MKYLSTRSEKHPVNSAQAVLLGLAPDGGLYMPENIPELDIPACLASDPLQMANRILSALLPDIPDMEALVRKAYTGKFQTEELTPTVQAGPFTVLELFRGPTSAFKDVAFHAAPADDCGHGMLRTEAEDPDPDGNFRRYGKGCAGRLPGCARY